MPVRWARTVENTAALVAYGVTASGRRQLLGVAIGSEESEDSWAEILRDLNDRGLRGVRLVVSDDHKGLKKAVRAHLPQARHQRCVAHFMRNILSRVPRRIRGSVGNELSADRGRCASTLEVPVDAALPGHVSS